MLFEERRLEWQQRQHKIEIFRHGASAVRAHGPHLRSDIIDGGNVRVGAFEARAMRWVKSGLSISTTASGCVASAKSAGLANAGKDFRNFGNNFAQTHNGSVIKREQRLQPLRCHRQPTDAGDLDVLSC